MRLSVLAFGDSITFGFCDPEGGWVARLRRAYDERNMTEDDADYRVYNLGISGETSDDLLARCDHEIAPRVRSGRCVVLLAIGINDVRYLQDEQRFQVPIERAAANVRQLITRARAATVPDVIVLGLTRVEESRTTPIEWHPNLSYRNADIERYDEAIASESTALRCPYVELASIGWVPALLEDGLHPNAEGHARISERVRDVLVRDGLL